jgi:hypothetical protein
MGNLRGERRAGPRRKVRASSKERTMAHAFERSSGIGESPKFDVASSLCGLCGRERMAVRVMENKDPDVS